jgi:hypothetical protein
LIAILGSILLIEEVLRTTKNFLDYQTAVKIELIDPNIRILKIPPLILKFNLLGIKIPEILSKMHNLKAQNKFDDIQYQMKILKIFELEILKNGFYLTYEEILQPIIGIEFLGDLQNHTSIYHWFKNTKNILLEAQNLKETKGYLNYFLFNKEDSLFNGSSIDLSSTYVNQRSFIKFRINNTYLRDTDTVFSIAKIFGNQVRNARISWGLKQEFFILRKSFEYLEYPFESSCSYYRKYERPFKSLSHNHCIQQCIRFNCEKYLNCSCVVINNTINQIYFRSANLKICEIENRKLILFLLKYEKLCNNYCPKDCINEDFIVLKQDDADILYKDDPKIQEIFLSWDDSKLFINYKEIPVMTFTDYFCYIGGLFGMWFGISANQIFEYLNKFKNSFTLLKFLYILLNALNVIQTKLLQIISYFEN